MALGLCDGKHRRVISEQERLERVVASEGLLTCLAGVL